MYRYFYEAYRYFSFYSKIYTVYLFYLAKGRQTTLLTTTSAVDSDRKLYFYGPRVRDQVDCVQILDPNPGFWHLFLLLI
jgi:hypothetical protein